MNHDAAAVEEVAAAYRVALEALLRDPEGPPDPRGGATYRLRSTATR